MGSKRQSSAEDTRGKGVTEHHSGETAPKRKRVSRACDQCRAAREKCDGIQPLCFPCTSQNRSCSWAEPKKKRGVQTGYIRTLEMALGWIFDRVPEAETALQSLLTHESGQGRALLVGKDTSAGTRLHRRWRKSRVHAEIERALSSDSALEKFANDSTAGEESGEEDRPEKGLSTTYHTTPTPTLSEPIDRPRAEFEASRRTQLRAQPPWRENTVVPKYSQTDHPGSPLSSRPLTQPRRSAAVLPSNHWRLLDIYFHYTHIWFPILEKHELLKTRYTYPDEGLHITKDTPGSAGHAELWSALTLASFQEAASEASKNNAGVCPDTLRMEPMDIYSIARGLIPTEDGLFEIRHINALLLLTLVNIASDNLRAAWVLIGTASRVALSWRLHEHMDSMQHRQSSHTYMGCFILDTMLSARLGLLPHLRAGMAHKSQSRLDNDLDEWQPWTPCLDFGPTRNTTRPSRMPSLSISSFRILHRIHLALSHRMWDEHKNSFPSGSAFLQRLQTAVDQCGADASLSNCVLTGDDMASQPPSTHLLRLAFLSAACMFQDTYTPQLHRTVLNCIESYAESFSICASCPLLTVFMNLVDQQAMSDMLTVEERARWEQVEKAITSVWAKPTRSYELGFESGGNQRPTHHPHLSNITPFGPVTPKVSSQQPLATATFRSNVNMNMEVPFVPDPNAETSRFMNHQPHAASQTLALNSGPAAAGDFGEIDSLTGTPTLHFPVAGRPNFSSSAIDYDTILDDIASFERANVPESETQFMANLGLRPGTNLADVFSHEFMGFP